MHAFIMSNNGKTLSVQRVWSGDARLLYYGHLWTYSQVSRLSRVSWFSRSVHVLRDTLKTLADILIMQVS